MIRGYVDSLRFGGMRVIVVCAEDQARTPFVMWRIPPAPTPSKRAGRRGTRRQWKRANPPRFFKRYEEPTDFLMSDTKMIVTPKQLLQLNAAIDRENAQRPNPYFYQRGK